MHVEALQRLQNQIRDQMVQNENDDRAERKRFLRLLQNEQFELDMEEAIQKVSFTIHFYIIFFLHFLFGNNESQLELSRETKYQAKDASQ